MKLISFALVALLSMPAHAEITLRLGSASYPPITTAAKDGVADLVYQELARRLGIKIIIHDHDAAERVLINANTGVEDGDASRIPGLEKKYPNLVQIPVSVFHYEMAVFSKEIDLPVVTRDSIKPYNIGIIRGWKILEEISTGAHSVTSLESGEQVFSMLDKGRIQIALFEKYGHERPPANGIA